MTEELKEQNTLYAWATGKFVMTCLGIAVGCYLFDSGLVQKAWGKIFSKKEE